jgi:outer membrane protein assembly factor BamB
MFLVTQNVVRGLTSMTVLWFSFSTLSADDHWPQFRGKNSTGAIETPTEFPDKWSATENVVWKTDIPGRGWSSPVVWGDRIFVSSVKNLGESEFPKKGLYFGGDRKTPPPTIHQWLVYCLDLKTGDILWEKKVREGKPESSIHLKNSFASETPVTDGKHVYFYFGNVGLYCFDFKGNQVWEKKFKPHQTRLGWGTAASPVLDGDFLYIVDDNNEESSLQVFNKKDGSVAFTVPRDKKSNWSTPFIWHNDLRSEIVTPGSTVRSYDLKGKLLWSLKGMSSITIATPYEYDGKLFISSGYVGDARRPLYAIRPGASGDISLKVSELTNEFIVWSKFKGGPYNPTTIPYKGNIYVLHDRGFVVAYRASDGELVYDRKRLKNGRAFTSSPWAYDDKLFCLNEDGATYVVQTGKDFNVLHKNTLEKDDMCMASPALVGNKLLIRTDKRIYCIGKK